MVTTQRDGVLQHFGSNKIITGEGVHVNDLSLNDAFSEFLSVIAATPHPVDTVDIYMTGSIFIAFASTDGSTAVKTAAALAAISKLVAECLWPATSADITPHSGMRSLDCLILLPSKQPRLRPRPLHSISPSSILNPASEDTETARSGSTRVTSSRRHEHRRGDWSQDWLADYGNAGAPGEVEFLCVLCVTSTRKLRTACNLACTRERWRRPFPCTGRTHRGKQGTKECPSLAYIFDASHLHWGRRDTDDAHHVVTTFSFLLSPQC